MKHKSHWFIILGGVVLIALGLAFSMNTPTPTLAQDPQDTPTPNPVGEPPTFLQDIYSQWVGSPHADVTAEAFNHWNEDEGKAVPESCAKCHSTGGYIDYLGSDGSAEGVVDAPAALGSVINCDACHSEKAQHLTEVTFPSGVTITDLGDSTRCMVCHQGRAYGGSVTDAVAKAGLTDGNTPSADLGFINIHYFAAAAGLYGADVHGGFEYEGQRYQQRFNHVDGVDTCNDCHNQHTLEIRVELCSTCHEGVNSKEDLKDIRMNGSLVDYDGDGNIEEGISGEVTGLQEMLLAEIQNYAREVAGMPIVYDAGRYPYFFEDTNDNGAVDEGEGKYTSFTGNLLQAAYNYQMVVKDPGAFAHNAKYYIELMYDSIADLNANATTQVDLSAAHRDDVGHFDSAAEPFRHWDGEEVSATCTKCHTAEGLPFLLEKGVLYDREPSQSMACTTCHSSMGVDNWNVYTSDEVTMPSGAVVSFGEGNPSNICLNCHQGRESTVSINAAIAKAAVGDDEVSDALRFSNPHYFAAGATLFGNDAMGAYQFDGKDYNGQNLHVRAANECSECHDQHALTIRIDTCENCHDDINTQEDVKLIREDGGEDPIDYNGNGDLTEPIAAEMGSFYDALLVQIQDYATNTLGTPIAYNSGAYPYWFIDTNANGVADPEESNRDNAYATWTPNLLRAAYNYQYVTKDPGAFAHNPDYVMQVLYDSIQALGGDDAVATFTRPPVLD
jgi:hypothetical protein